MKTTALLALNFHKSLDLVNLFLIMALLCIALVLLERKPWDKISSEFGRGPGWLVGWTVTMPTFLVGTVILLSALLSGFYFSLEENTLDYLLRHHSATVEGKVVENSFIKNSPFKRVKVSFHLDGSERTTTVIARKQEPATIVKLHYVKGRPGIAMFAGGRPSQTDSPAKPLISQSSLACRRRWD